MKGLMAEALLGTWSSRWPLEMIMARWQSVPKCKRSWIQAIMSLRAHLIEGIGEEGGVEGLAGGAGGVQHASHVFPPEGKVGEVDLLNVAEEFVRVHLIE